MEETLGVAPARLLPFHQHFQTASQRDEVGRRGSNLYFNPWNYDCNVEEIPLNR